jgi:hypothetical protein
MLCRRCGTEVSSDDAFCRRCGARIELSRSSSAPESRGRQRAIFGGGVGVETPETDTVPFTVHDSVRLRDALAMGVPLSESAGVEPATEPAGLQAQTQESKLSLEPHLNGERLGTLSVGRFVRRVVLGTITALLTLAFIVGSVLAIQHYIHRRHVDALRAHPLIATRRWVLNRSDRTVLVDCDTTISGQTFHNGFLFYVKPGVYAHSVFNLPEIDPATCRVVPRSPVPGFSPVVRG